MAIHPAYTHKWNDFVLPFEIFKTDYWKMSMHKISRFILLKRRFEFEQQQHQQQMSDIKIIRRIKNKENEENKDKKRKLRLSL